MHEAEEQVGGGDAGEFDHLLPAVEAAALLGVKLPTLYSYASRGVVTSVRRPDRRGSWFDPAELDQVARRGRTGSATRLSDMQFQSSVTLVDQGRFFYRGQDPARLAVSASFEEVADLLWGGDAAGWTAQPQGVRSGRAAVSTLGPSASVLDRLRVAVPAAGSVDPMRFDLRPDAVVRRAGDILMTLAAACSDQVELDESYPAAVAALIGAPTTSLPLLEAALILLADHEVAASTAAVRIAASFRADPYAAIGSGLAVLSGAYHGAASVAVARLLDDAIELGGAAAVGEVLHRGEAVPGLGQVLYPDGDPRYPALMDVVRHQRHDHPVVAVADEIERLAAERGFPAPNVDFGLAVATRVLGLGSRAGETIFAFARMAGWLAHAVEEYADRTALRLRANYLGPRPAPR